MRFPILSKHNLAMLPAAILAAMTCAAGGCHEYVNPWLDETAGSEWITTASVEGAVHESHEPVQRTRGLEAVPVAAQDGTVGHFPLWWQDPFEDAGSDDSQFAWTWEDYFAMPYGLGRFIVNTIGLPGSAVVYPPVPLRGSDGVAARFMPLSMQDPEWLPSGGSPTPPDVLEIGSLPLEAE